eukprot:719582_1
MAQIEKNKWTAEDSAFFAGAESFWYTLHDIPGIQNRLLLWGFKMGFDEMVEDQQKKVNILIDAHSQIAESIKLKQILKVVLAVGNYLNASSKKNGEANGIRLEVLSKLDGTKGADGGYSLLMYIYELINDKYPDSENIHEDFTLLPEAAKQDIEALQGEIEKIRDEVGTMSTNLNELKAQYAAKASCSSTDERKDKFIEVMDEWIKEAVQESTQLLDGFTKSIKDIIDLAISYGEKKSVTVENFFSIWTNFLSSWGKARTAIRKRIAAAKKQVKLEEKKRALKAKLERRANKKALKKQGVIKSKQDVKDHQRRMTLVSNLVRKNVKQKKEKLSHESRLGLKSRHHSIILQTLRYVCKHCESEIQDKMQASGEYCHKCWINPDDKATGNIKLKQLKWLSSQRQDPQCKFGHSGTCVAEKQISNPLLAGIMEIRKTAGVGGAGHSAHFQGSKANKRMLPMQFSKSAGEGPNGQSALSVPLKVGRADSGGTIHHLLGGHQHRRGKSSNQRKEYEALGHTVTDVHFHQLAESLQEWRKNEFDPATAPEMPSIGVAQAKVKARNNQMAQNKKRKTQFGNNISADVGAGFGTGNVVTDKYKQKLRGNRRHRKKGTTSSSSSNKRSVQFSTNVSDVPNGDTSLEKDDTLSPLGQLKNLRITAEKGARRSGPKDIVLSLSPSTSHSNSFSNHSHQGGRGHQAKGSVFMDSGSHGRGSQGSQRGFRHSGTFNRHRKNSNSGAASPRQAAQNTMRRRRSTIEHNVHVETFKLRDEQKEQMDNPEFITELRQTFTPFGSFTYDAMNMTVGLVLIAQRMRKDAFAFLETRLGPIDTNTGGFDSGDDDLKTPIGESPRSSPRVSFGSRSDQRRFLLTDMQLEVLSSTQFMQQIVQDFTHFGTLNVHEDELVLESYKRSRTIAACQKLERRLGALWTVEEVAQCMEDFGRSEDDLESRSEQLKFLGSMVQTVSSGARFRKHRKHGKAAHRWVLIDKDRLYWKENTGAQNQKTRSFNLAKIVAIQPGKHTSALKNAEDVEDSQCFSVVSKKHVTLDLSGEDDNTVLKWIVYLTAYNRHYKQQANAAQAQKSMSNVHTPKT